MAIPAMLFVFATVWTAQPTTLPQAPTKPELFQIRCEDESLKPWAEKAQKLMEQWYPKICSILGRKERKPSEPVVLDVQTHGQGVAATGGHHIGVNGDYVRGHQDDIGLVVHELAHVVQSYPTYRPSWVVEGIADYVRFFNYEPVSARPHPNPDRASYRDSYRITAAFFDWCVRKHGRNFVKKLDECMKENTYSADVWVKLGGKPLDDLWADYANSLRAEKQKKLGRPAPVPEQEPFHVGR